MNTAHLDDFKKYLDDQILPSSKDLGNLTEANRKHVQKLVFTNMVDRFDVTIDLSILANCREESLLDSALKGMDQSYSEGDVVRLLLAGEGMQSALDKRLQAAIRLNELRDRHSKKLCTLLRVLGLSEEAMRKPRVNPAKGKIFAKFTQQDKKIPASILGYADWLYSRRNAVVHGSGSSKMLDNDKKQLNALYKCTPAPTFRITLKSIDRAAEFYGHLVDLAK